MNFCAGPFCKHQQLTGIKANISQAAGQLDYQLRFLWMPQSVICKCNSQATGARKKGSMWNRKSKKTLPPTLLFLHFFFEMCFHHTAKQNYPSKEMKSWHFLFYYGYVFITCRQPFITLMPSVAKVNTSSQAKLAARLLL